MKKLCGFILGSVLVLGIVSMAFAQESQFQAPVPGCMGAMQGKMMNEEGKPAMGPMHKMQKMMQATMVATKDGGIIVLKGNKLLKYDKDLNLVKEVEISGSHEGKYGMKGAMDKKGCGCHHEK